MKDLIDKLQVLGIPRREAEVYFALLQKREFTAPEIAGITSLSRTKSYEILQNLAKKGLCNQNYRNGIKVFSCIEPKIVMENILSDYEEKINVANQLQTNLSEVYNSRKKDEPLDYIEVLNDTRQIKDRWLTLQMNAKLEMLVFTKAPYILQFSENISPEKSALEKKIHIKAIYEYYNITEESNPNFISMLNSFAKLGEEIKLIHTLPMKLAIFDEKVTMLALNDPVSMNPSITTMIVDHASFALSLKKVFESFWTDSIPLDDFKKLKAEGSS